MNRAGTNSRHVRARAYREALREAPSWFLRILREDHGEAHRLALAGRGSKVFRSRTIRRIAAIARAA